MARIGIPASPNELQEALIPRSGKIKHQDITGSVEEHYYNQTREMSKAFGQSPGVVSELQGRALDQQAELALATLKKIVHKGKTNPESVIRKIGERNKAFGDVLNMQLSMDPMYQLRKSLQSVGSEFESFTGKNFTTTSPLSTGFVPFDLLPLVRLIYPNYSPLRNKIPRVPGQGTSHRAKILSSVTGALPGGLGTIQRDSIAELPAGGGLGPTNWPNQLPPSGEQTAYDLNIPYRFFGLTESISWLAQFASQGFDDAYGVASLVLLQEFMGLEERDNIAATSQNLATPANPTLLARTAGSNETPLSGVTSDVWVKVTALNYWGETSTVTSGANIAVSTGQVVDVTISPVPGAIAYNIYVGTGSTQPANYYLFASSVGGSKYTLQGAIPVTGTTPPVSDTGTGSSSDPEGLITQLSGKSALNNVYPPEALAGYFNHAAGTTLTTDLVVTALTAMWDGATGYLADPREIIVEGSDAANLAKDVRESTQNYLLQVTQDQMGNVTTGVAVAEIQNPITRSTVVTAVHPYLPQGNAILMSYTLPQPQNNVSNVCETVMVQDYVEIGWPVVDVTFRQSIFRYGAQALLYAPQYCGLIQGIQRSSTTPYS